MENKPNGSHSADLPPSAAEFIRQVCHRMRYRKKATEDVQTELMAHFEEELRDCPDPQERQKKAQRLVEQFGDIEMLAALCRRAKKRCRPLWAKIVVRSLEAAGVCIVLLGLYVVWFVNGKPTVKVDYLALLNQMSQPVIAEQDNAWPYYERAIAHVVAPNPELREMPAYQHSDYAEYEKTAGLPDDTRRAIGKWIEVNHAAWEQFALAGSKPYFAKSYQTRSDVNEPWLLSVRLPDLSALRYVSRVGLWLSRMDAEQGRIAEALEDCLAVARAGRHWQHTGTLMEQLVALSLCRTANEEILRIVSRQGLSAAELADLQRKLTALYPQGFPPVEVQSERLVFLDVVQRVFTDDGPGGGHLVPAVATKLLKEVVQGDYWEAEEIPFLRTTLSLLHAGRDATVAKAEEVFDYQRELSGLSPYEKRARQATTIDQMVMSLPAYRHALVRTLVPALDRIMELGFQGKALHEATLTVLALERYRREKGPYPAALDELKTAGYLATLPMDPYAGGTLAYKTAGGGCVLYSCGPNFRDDRGKSGTDRKGRPHQWVDNGDTVFWPVNP